jgi:RNA polymerase sigma factor (sigma-70 family)
MIDVHYVYINELVEKIKSGQQESLHELFDFYKPLILTSIKRCASKEKELYSFYEDLVSESIFVFEKLVKNYDSELSYFSYYLSTRIDHSLLNHFKSTFISKHPTTDIEIPNASDFYDPFEKIQNAIVIEEAIDKLNPKQQEAIRLYFFDEMGQDEAARVLGITQASFSKRLSRALDKLKEHLSESFNY